MPPLLNPLLWILLAALCFLTFMLVSTGITALSDARQSRAIEREVRRHDDLIEHLRVLAWQHRDISPALASDLIEKIREFQAATIRHNLNDRRVSQTRFVDELREAAWQAREDDPEFSVIALDEIATLVAEDRAPGRRRLGGR